MARTVPFHGASRIPSTAWHKDLLAQTQLSETPLAPGLHSGLSFWPPAVSFVGRVLQVTNLGLSPNQSPATDYPWPDSRTAGKGGGCRGAHENGL